MKQIQTETSADAAGLSCTDANTRAFISISASDEIRDMPVNYNVPTSVSVNGANRTTISTDWAGLLDGGIDDTLQNAGVDDSSQREYHSGSNSDGSLNANNCSGYTSASLAEASDIGSQTTAGSGWLTGATTQCDNGSGVPRSLVCICWQ